MSLPVLPLATSISGWLRQGKASDISGHSSNLDSYTNVHSTLRNGHKHIIVREEKKKISVSKSRRNPNTRKETNLSRKREVCHLVRHTLAAVDKY